MTNHHSQFQVEQLRMKNLIKVMESLLVLMLSLFLSAILPALLIRFVYAGQQLFEQPPVLEYLPVVVFVVSVGYFLFAMVGNMLREMKAQKMEQELVTLSESCGCGGCECHHDDEMMMQEVSAAKAKKVSKKK